LESAGIPCQLASKSARYEPPVMKLLAAFRVLSGNGAFVDLNHLTGLSAAGISKETLAGFKQWAYGKRLKLTTAMHTAERIPIPGMSQRRQTRLVGVFRLLQKLRAATEEMSVARTLEHIAGHTSLSVSLTAEQLRDLVGQALACGNQSGLFADTLALEQDVDLFRSGIEKVGVMTMHASKGLEFSNVFIAGCEDGLIPYRFGEKRGSDIEEERRLFYVAATRARKRLFLTRAHKRTVMGKTRVQSASPFLADIDDDLKAFTGDPVRSGAPRQEQLSLF
jgi:superfamily I DNA/RNA helicase